MTRELMLLGLLAGVPLISAASNVTLQGSFAADDDIELFSISIATPGTVDLRSYGYAGGTTSTGIVVPRGGFDTILTLFNASGAFLTDNDDGAGVATDPETGLAADARITTTLNPGRYLLALTEYDNFSNGNLADGFVETGHPNFTADPTFTTGGPCPGNLFRDISGTAGRCRTGNWTVDFDNVASVTPAAPAPEPSALLLAGVGITLLLAARYRRRKMKTLVTGGMVAALAGGLVHAQTSPDPDYSEVSDILDGQRTLLQVTDLMVTAYDQKFGRFYSTPITTSNSQQTPQTQYRWLAFAQAVGPSYSALMFNQPYATTITTGYNDVYPAGSGTPPYFDLLFQNGTDTSNWRLYRPLAAGDSPTVASGVVADFTLSGYDDLALSLNDGRLLIVTPNDRANTQRGLRNGITKLDVLKDMAAGDFRGDGGCEIAGLTISNGGLKLVIYDVDPKTLTATPASSLTLTTPGASPSTPITLASIARGRFNSAGHDQLAVAFTREAGPAYVEIIDFDPGTLNAHEASPTRESPAGNIGFPYGYIQVKTGQFGLPNNPYDQIVYHSSSPQNGGRFFEVITVDPTNFKIGTTTPILYNNYPGAVGIQVGNFDHLQGKQPNLNAQIAFMYFTGKLDSVGNQGVAMNIYSVNASTFDVINPPESAIDLTGTLVPGKSTLTSVSFAATDLQGRSYVLGPPTKVVVKRSIQPSVIAAMPPMHVDFVPPGKDAPPEELNLSVIPSGFNTTYQTNQTNTTQSSTINTTSWSFGAQQSLEVGFEVGSVDAGLGLKGSSVSTAAQELKSSIETEHGRYTQTRFDASVTTGFSDAVWFSSSRFNIWIYPVLGRTVCPAGTGAKCSQPKPLTIQFSAPDDVEYARWDGSLLPWYQPVWEPGNVLSYPADVLQLKAIAPNFKQLSTAHSFATDGGQTTETINWNDEESQGLTASFDQNYSFSQEFSLTGAVSTPVVSASITGTLNFSGSNGFSDLNKSITNVGSSKGISVEKPGNFANPAVYAYSFTPYIFGQNQSATVVDEEPLDADVKTHGLLRTAFLADPIAVNPNGWWKQTYNKPDIALNHPQRWLYENESGVAAGTSALSNCRNTDCVYLQKSNPKDLWSDAFHYMRGFFISNAQNPGKGPQLDTAQAGDQLSLQVRVYNYSLAAMPSDSKVHVRFYVQRLDKNDHSPVGDSVLIGNKDVVLDPIPPVGDVDARPNWVLAKTDFDTTPFGGENLVFWVIAWAQEANGDLLQEMPGHGLRTVPGVLKSFADIQTDEEKYSNNVGFYNSEFYVFANDAVLTASGSGEPATIDIQKVQLSSESGVPGQILDVSAQLFATGNSASGVDAAFYDGDPDAGGTPFGYELSPYIAENDTYQVKAPYVASACGTHQLFIVVGQGTSHEVVRRAPTVRIECTSASLKQ